MNIGLALGSGSARGWAHIGIISALAAQGIVPDIVCGTSIGSLVGASYVSNTIERLEEWVRSLTKFQTARFFEINLALNGFVNKERLHQFLSEYVASEDALIENLDKRYAAVATELETGREVWLVNGPVLKAVWSSISLPGLFPGIKNEGRWIVDGALVNPVPVSVCRALGADIVIAVNLNGDVFGRCFQRAVEIKKQEKSIGAVSRISDLVTECTASFFSTSNAKEQVPSFFEAIAGSFDIMQDRITRSRMAGDPPDILLSPRLAQIGLLEFYRANEAILEGRQCVQRMLPVIQHVLGLDEGNVRLEER
jgi:NTE family protein